MAKIRKASHDFLIHPNAKKHPNQFCKWCGLRLPKFKKSFCGTHCVSEWRIRTSPSYARQLVIERDNGVCKNCGLDTLAFKTNLEKLFPRKSKKKTKYLLEKGFHPNRAFSEVDHILEVAKGGGLCGLDNLILLCYPCHLKKTKAMKDV